MNSCRLVFGYLTLYSDNGIVVVRGRLSPEIVALVQRALEAASDRLYHDAEDPADVSVCQRRADAFGLIAESALAADLDRGTAADRYQVVVHVDADSLERDAEPPPPARVLIG